jgi:hypothetical protein
MRRPLAAVAFLLAPAVAVQPRTQLEVTLPVPAAQARARVAAAFADQQLAVESATGDVVAAAYNETPFVRATFRAAVIAADSATSRVVLTGVLNTPQAGSFPAETIPLAESGRRQGKPGQRAWQRLTRVAAALSDSTRAQ